LGALELGAQLGAGVLDPLGLLGRFELLELGLLELGLLELLGRTQEEPGPLGAGGLLELGLLELGLLELRRAALGGGLLELGLLKLGAHGSQEKPSGPPICFGALGLGLVFVGAWLAQNESWAAPSKSRRAAVRVSPICNATKERNTAARTGRRFGASVNVYGSNVGIRLTANRRTALEYCADSCPL
jgi:hypothetical protein